MASPCKRRKTGSQLQQNRFNFGIAARMKFQVSEFLSATVANFLKLMAKSRNTSPEMIMAAALPTTAACMGTKAGLQLKPYSDYVISGNLFMIGVAEPGCGKSSAFDVAMGMPLNAVSMEEGKSIHVAECSKAALLKVQRDLDGRGIICADEVSQFLTGMLRRSQTDTSGERQLLLTLWGGRGHNIAYASKAHIELQKSGLCIGGFTQPDRMMEIIEEMKGSSDGLFDRFLFWLLPGYIYNGKKMREAHNSFRTSFLLHSLNPVFLEIYRAHSTDSSIVYRFSPEAQDFFNDIEDRVRIGVAEIAEAVIVESGDEDDSDDEREPIKSPIGTKFIDQLGRLSLSLHLFSSVLEQILGRMEGQISIPVEISLDTITSAKQLLDHLMRQNDVILDSIYPTNESSMFMAQEVLKPVVDMKTEISKRILLDAGCAYPIRQASRTRLRGETVKSSVVSDVMETLTRNGLGAEKKVKVSKTKPLSIFFKEIPSSVNKSALEGLGISFEFYQHQFYLPVSVAFNIERHVLELHPNAKEIKEHVKRNNHLPSNDS